MRDSGSGNRRDNILNRLCIFVIYDAQCVIREYLKYVLEELRKYSTYLCVVCNFEKAKNGIENISPYADEIIYRSNEGYDAGAYKETLVFHMTREKLLEYDELLLSNDSYLAPLYPFDEMFEIMGKVECDFWGITTQPAGLYLNTIPMKAHIQSYFLDFKKEVLHSDCFYEFWKNYEPTSDRQETIEKFELGLNEYLRSNGYKGKSFMECSPYMDYYEKFDDRNNPYVFHGLELIRDLKIPIYKRNNIDFRSPAYGNQISAYEFIRDNGLYDTKILCQDIKYNETKTEGTHYDKAELERFVKTHKRVFIYGKGLWGMNLSHYFRYKGWRYESFLLSDARNDDEALTFADVDIESNDGIIIALGRREVCSEIYNTIREKIDVDHIFTPRFE